jgi:hypothetical protein
MQMSISQTYMPSLEDMSKEALKAPNNPLAKPIMKITPDLGSCFGRFTGYF